MPLVAHFIHKLGKVVRISSHAADMLMSYSWPGNIRELENVIERAIILCGVDGEIRAEHLPAWLQGNLPLQPAAATLDGALAALEERMIVEALESAKGNMAKAAASLGITERIMGLRMKKYDLDFRLFRKGDIERP